MSATDTQDQAVGQDLAFDDSGFLSQALRPDRYPFEVRLIDEREFLMPAYTLDGASYLDSKDGWKWKGLRFERRPMWVIEMNQLDRNYIYSKRVLYFDKETLVPHFQEMYDQKGRYYRHLDVEWGQVAPLGYLNAIPTSTTAIGLTPTAPGRSRLPIRAIWLSGRNWPPKHDAAEVRDGQDLDTLPSWTPFPI